MHYSRCRHAACAERSVSRCDGSGHAACPADHPPFRCAVYYGYAPDNKRIYQVAAGPLWIAGELDAFFGAHGEKLGVYTWVDTGIGFRSGGYRLQHRDTDDEGMSRLIRISGAA